MEDIATDLITKASAYIAEAERALKRPTYWGLLRQQSENYDDAADLYKQAANTYKFLKDWPDAYRYYMIAAKYTAGNVEISHLDEVSATIRTAVVPIIIQAAEALEHFDRARAIKLYITVANLYILSNQYDKAANITAYAALLMRTDGDRQAALTTYQLAAEYYRVSSHNYFKEIECLEMVAKIWIECAAAAAAAANIDEARACAREAAYTYKVIAAKQLEKTQNISASFRVYQPLFNSVICTFYFDDFVAIKNWYADCCRMLPAFETISDGVFLGKLIQIIESSATIVATPGAVEQIRAKYQQLCHERETSKPLETWMLNPLLYQLEQITTLEENSEEVDLS